MRKKLVACSVGLQYDANVNLRSNAVRYSVHSSHVSFSVLLYEITCGILKAAIGSPAGMITVQMG